MILTDLGRALGQFGDRRFQSVLWRGIGLTLGLLAALVWLAVRGADLLTPAQVALPWIGPVGGVHWLAGGAAALAMLVLSGFLMVPVAAAFTSLFLDEVAAAVEARHYPGLAPARPQGWAEMLGAGLRLALLSLGVNLIALVVYLLSGPFAPLVFWAVNGALIGREYAEGAALRRLPPAAARGLIRANRGQIFGLGLMLAVVMTVPVVNLAAPVLAAAAFTHMVSRLAGRSAHPTASARG